MKIIKSTLSLLLCLSIFTSCSYIETESAIKEKLTPVLGEDHLIVSPKQNIDKSIRKFLHAIGR